MSYFRVVFFYFFQGGVATRGAPADAVLAVEALGPAAAVLGVLAAGQGGTGGHGGRASR